VTEFKVKACNTQENYIIKTDWMYLWAISYGALNSFFQLDDCSTKLKKEKYDLLLISKRNEDKRLINLFKETLEKADFLEPILKLTNDFKIKQKSIPIVLYRENEINDTLYTGKAYSPEGNDLIVINLDVFEKRIGKLQSILEKKFEVEVVIAHELLHLVYSHHTNIFNAGVEEGIVTFLSFYVTGRKKKLFEGYLKRELPRRNYINVKLLFQEVFFERMTDREALNRILKMKRDQYRLGVLYYLMYSKFKDLNKDEFVRKLFSMRKDNFMHVEYLLSKPKEDINYQKDFVFRLSKEIERLYDLN
jgi:hypothetical protein